MKKIMMVFCLLGIFCEPLLAEEIKLTVPFLAQTPPGTWLHTMNCGPTATIMLDGYYNEKLISSDDIIALDDWLYEKGYIHPQLIEGAVYYDGNATNVSSLQSVLSGYFFLGPVVFNQEKDLLYLKDKLQKKNPVIVAVTINMDESEDGHFMLVVGMDDDEIIVHDPGKTAGAYNRYSQEQFLKSWATSNYASVLVDVSETTWHPNGALVQISGRQEQYQIIDGKIHYILNEAVFHAHDFDSNKVVFISTEEFQCYENSWSIDWQPYREFFSVAEVFYLMEKSSYNSTSCAYYDFSSELAFHSWQQNEFVESLSLSNAQTKYFDKCVYGGTLYLRDGTLVKPTFAVAGFGAGVVFVATNNGELRGFETGEAFQDLGYSKYPLLLAGAEQFFESFQNFGSLIIESETTVCLKENISGGGVVVEEDFIDQDGDGYNALLDDCDDASGTTNPGAIEFCDEIDNDCDGQIDEEVKNNCGNCDPVVPTEICNGVDDDCDGLIDEDVKNACGTCGLAPEEVCDNLDNDCDGQVDENLNCDFCQPEMEICNNVDDDCDGLIDEGVLCGSNQICSAGQCQNQQSPGQDVSEEEFLNCTITCPSGYRAYAWYGSFGEAKGTPSAVFSVDWATICQRGGAWIDFNCATIFPKEWFGYDPNLAVVQCDHDFAYYYPGLVDWGGEGELWFAYNCFD
ncbi:MAG: MopE-related protein [Patescibacteria group bacterium]